VEHAKDLPPPERDDFAGAVTRTLVVRSDGYYVFYVQATDKARLTVAGATMVDADGSNGRYEQATVAALRRGTYALRLEYRHPLKDSAVNLRVFQNQDDDVEWWKHPVLKLADDEPR
jgi:hypothetical protein